MSIKLAPPPLQVPPEFAGDRLKAAFFNGLLNTVYQMWTALYGIRTTAKLATTDATATSMIRVSVEAGKTVMIEARIAARRTGGAAGADGDSAFYILTGAYKNVAGVLTGIGTPDLIAGEDQAGWNVAFSSSGAFAIILVTGAANNNITWEGTVSTYTVGA